MSLHAGASGAGTGLPVVGGLNNSVLFVNPAGTLAQDSANFNYVIGTGVLTAPTITATTKYLGPAGAPSAPIYGFSSDPTTGAYNSSAGSYDISISGVRRFAFNASTLFLLNDAAIVALGSGQDLQFTRAAANTHIWQNGNNAQEGRISAGNGGFVSYIKSVTESLTIAAAATTVGATSIPAGAILLGVSVRVTTVIPTAATFTYATTVGGTTLNTAAVSTAAGSTDPGTAAGASFRAAATTVTITPNATPGAATGVVRLHYYYLQVTPPTS